MAVATDAQFHVLAVDDSLIDRKLIERLLKSSSFQVTTVDSGSKALELLGLQQQEDHKRQQQQLQQIEQQPNSPSVSSYRQEIQVSLVITDYCMPGMTGYDLLKKIKESSSLKDIPVVIMSSENVPSRINRCLAEGADEFLLKPVKLSDMKKLRPRVPKKGKSKEQLLAEQNNKEELDSQGPQEQQQHKPLKELNLLQLPLQQSNQSGTTTTTIVGTTTKTLAGNKRKAMDSEVPSSPDEMSRPNYKVKGYGLTVV